MTTVTIDDNIPLPEITTSTRKPRHPAHLLGVNQSYFAEGADLTAVKASISAIGRRTDKKFVALEWSQGEGEAAVSGVRVWRSA